MLVEIMLYSEVTTRTFLVGVVPIVDYKISLRLKVTYKASHLECGSDKEVQPSHSHTYGTAPEG